MASFEEKIKVRWSDVDQNGHVRHSAYYDYGAHTRIAFFNALGFDARTLMGLKIGPILFKETCTFLKEIPLSEQISLNILRGEGTADGSRWTLHHEIFNSKKEKCAHLTCQGAWLDLSKRKLCVPPAELAQAVLELEAGAEFVYKKG